MMPLPSEIELYKSEIKTSIYLGIIVSFTCGFVLAGILIKIGVITV